MIITQAHDAVTELPSDTLASRDVAKLVRKLRWIGMETEARKMQAVLLSLPADERPSCLAGPHSTD